MKQIEELGFARVVMIAATDAGLEGEESKEPHLGAGGVKQSELALCEHHAFGSGVGVGTLVAGKRGDFDSCWHDASRKRENTRSGSLELCLRVVGGTAHAFQTQDPRLAAY